MPGLRLALVALLQIGLMNGGAKPKQYVEFGGETATVAAGKKSVVELHFRVMEGFHVNSHTPKSELLIPTVLTVTGAVGPVEYPKGQEYSFSFNPGETLDVYSGAFTVKVPVAVSAGAHTVNGTLRYQACDKAACYPPKTLAVAIPVVARD